MKLLRERLYNEVVSTQTFCHLINSVDSSLFNSLYVDFIGASSWIYTFIFLGTVKIIHYITSPQFCMKDRYYRKPPAMILTYYFRLVHIPCPIKNNVILTTGLEITIAIITISFKIALRLPNWSTHNTTPLLLHWSIIVPFKTNSIKSSNSHQVTQSLKWSIIS